MIGHKTSGDWTDVTSYGRNEIVFEGRNREYGAYVVRQRYNGTLLMALLIAASFGALIAAVPMVMNLFHKAVPIEKTKEVKLDVHIYNLPRERKIEIPHTVLPPRAPAVSTRTAPPRIVHSEVIETIPTPTVTTAPTTDPTTTGDPHDGAVSPIDGGGTVVDPAPDQSHIYTIVQVKPEFSGGSVLDYLQKNTVYPEEYIEAGISGIVNYTFVVETDGSVSNVEILRGVAGGPMLADEVIKAIKKMPKWKPGMQNGYPVRVQYTGRISFMLREQ